MHWRNFVLKSGGVQFRNLPPLPYPLWPATQKVVGSGPQGSLVNYAYGKVFVIFCVKSYYTLAAISQIRTTHFKIPTTQDV